jgi:hypothetical protein
MEWNRRSVSIGNSILWLRWILYGLSGLLVLLFLATALGALRFHYDLNDTAMLSAVWRIAAGHPLYVPPSPQYIPFLYTPIYFYTVAALGKLTGETFLTLRLVSTLATCGCFVMVYLLVFREVRSRLAAFTAVGCFAACYPITLQWFNTGRVDMLFLFFLLCAMYATRHLHPVLAALLWVCAFQTKQGVLPIAVLALCHHWQRPRRILLGLGTFAAAMAISIAWLTHATGGWYRYYVFGMAGGFGFDRHQLVRYLTDDLLSAYSIALVVILAALLIAPVSWRSRAVSFYVLTSVGMILFTWYLRGHRGSATNALLPAYLWISVLFGLALARLLTALNALPQHLRDVAFTTLLAACCVQLAMHLYSPHEITPRAEQADIREAFEDQIRSIPGDVLVFSHPEAGVLAGKPLHAQVDAVGSVIEAKDKPKGDQLLAEYADLIHTRAYSAIALDVPWDFYTAPRFPRVWMPADFRQYYPLTVPAAGTHHDDNIRYGAQPMWIYLPCTSIDIARKLDPAVYTGGCEPHEH